MCISEMWVFSSKRVCFNVSHNTCNYHTCILISFLFYVEQIRNYNGAARIVVTLVTNEAIPKPHAHKLVGKNCNDGSCVVELKPNQNVIT